MMNPSDRISPAQPEVIERSCGGWLAVAPNGSCFSMGVTAPTEAEARTKFGYVFARWLEIVTDTEKVMT